MGDLAMVVKKEVKPDVDLDELLNGIYLLASNFLNHYSFIGKVEASREQCSFSQQDSIKACH